MGNPVTILAFGDSLTQGYGLADGDGLVPQLEGWLTDNGADVTLINAGVSGDTTAGGASRIDWSLSDEVDAVIVALGGNDLLRGLPVDSVESNLEKILTAIQAKDLPILLVGYQATANYGLDYKEDFDAIYPTLAERHDTLFYPHIFDGIVAEVAQGTATREALFQADGIHPNAEGVALNVAAMGPSVLELVSAVQAQ